jgi:chorismate synthase
MIGCHIGKLFQVTVSGGSYQDALTGTVQDIPPGMELSEGASQSRNL